MTLRKDLTKGPACSRTTRFISVRYRVCVTSVRTCFAQRLGPSASASGEKDPLPALFFFPNQFLYLNAEFVLSANMLKQLLLI